MVELYGKHNERNRKIEWLSGKNCRECEQKALAELREKESIIAAEQAKSKGLSELVGSEKQIAWAETIRKNALSDPRNEVPCVPYDLPEDKKRTAEDLRVIMLRSRNRLETEKSARWWIDNRNNVGGYVLECGRNSLNAATANI
jgi:hypothetical protein